MGDARRKLDYGDDNDATDRTERRRLGYESVSNTSLEPSSLHAVGESAKANFLKVKNKDELIRGAKARQRHQRTRTTQKQGRRNSVLKSLMVLDIDENDADYKAENQYQRPEGNGRRYLRRGSVTKHKLDAEVDGMQPTAREKVGGDESDYGSDYDSGCDVQVKEARRYLRRGSVTKYSLDSKPDKGRGMQPADVAENDHNFASNGQRLPPPPSNDFTPDKTYTKKQVSARRLSMPVMSPTRGPKAAPRRSASSDLPLLSPSDDYYSENLEDTGRRSRTSVPLPEDDLERTGRRSRTSVPLPGDDMWSGNLDDSGHNLSSKSKELRQKNSKAEDTPSASRFKRATKPFRKLSSQARKKDIAETTPRKSGTSKPSKNRKSILETQNSLDPEEDSLTSNTSTSLTSRSNASLGRKDSESDLDDSDGEFASEESSKQPIFAQRKNKKRPPRLPPTGNSSSLNDKKPPRSASKASSPIRKGLQTIEYERDSRSTSTTMSNSSWNDEVSVSSSSSRRKKTCLKKAKQKAPITAKAVRFGSIVITEFPIILGDNPAVTAGAPVTIDWNPQDEHRHSVTAYEQCKPKRRRRRKLLISVSNRAILLLAAGYSIDEIADASIQVQQIKSGRQESLQNQNWDRVNLLMEHGVGMVQTTNSAVTGAVTGMVQSTGKKLKSLVVKPVQQTETARMA